MLVHAAGGFWIWAAKLHLGSPSLCDEVTHKRSDSARKSVIVASKSGLPNEASPSLREEAEFGGKGIRTPGSPELFHRLPRMSVDMLK